MAAPSRHSMTVRSSCVPRVASSPKTGARPMPTKGYSDYASSGGSKSRSGGQRAPRRPSRSRRRPRLEDLETRQLLSGNPAIREFGIPTPSSDPSAITAGPDGNLWFTEAAANKIGRITPGGVVTEVAAGISPRSGPAAITAGPAGNLWFTEFDGNRIGRITPAGVVTEFSRGISPDSEPLGIAAGPDGNLWFAEANAIGRITPTGVVTEYFAGIAPGHFPDQIT